MLSHIVMLSHLQPHTEPHCHTFNQRHCLSHPQPRCYTQKYHHTLNNAGHTRLQPHGLLRAPGRPDVLTLAPPQRHADRQRHADTPGPGAPAAAVATWPHGVTAPPRSQGGEADLITPSPGCGTQLSLSQRLNQTSHSNNTTTSPPRPGVTEQAAQRLSEDIHSRPRYCRGQAHISHCHTTPRVPGQSYKETVDDSRHHCTRTSCHTTVALPSACHNIETAP